MLTISGARASRADAASAPSSALVSRNGPSDVGGQRRLEILAVGVGERHQRHRAERRGVVDEDVEAAERGRDLHRDRVDVLLARDVADDAVVPATSAATAWTRSAVRATKATAAPRRWSSRTSASPSPDVPPVMATRRPWSSERVMRPPGVDHVTQPQPRSSSRLQVKRALTPADRRTENFLHGGAVLAGVRARRHGGHRRGAAGPSVGRRRGFSRTIGCTRPRSMRSPPASCSSRRGASPIRFGNAVILLADFNARGRRRADREPAQRRHDGAGIPEPDARAGERRPGVPRGAGRQDARDGAGARAQRHRPRPDVFDGVYLLTVREAVESAVTSNAAPGRLRSTLGYAGWGPGQPKPKRRKALARARGRRRCRLRSGSVVDVAAADRAHPGDPGRPRPVELPRRPTVVTSSGGPMAADSLIRCPSCGATNRLPVDAIGHGKKAVCGRCKTPLAAGRPVAVSDATFAAEIERSPLPVLVDCGRRGAGRAGWWRRSSIRSPPNWPAASRSRR